MNPNQEAEQQRTTAKAKAPTPSPDTIPLLHPPAAGSLYTFLTKNNPNWKDMTEDKALCSTCFIWGKDRPALGNLCKNCNSYGLCERCAKKDVCLVCRQDLPNYDPAKDPRMGSNGKQKVWCATHGKKRGITNMDDNGDGSFYCKPECQCKDAGENPKGKGKERGKGKKIRKNKRNSLR